MNKRLLAAGMCALTLCLLPTLASAQTSAEPAITLLDVVTTSAASTTTTTVVLIDVFVCPPIRTACDVLSTTSELTSLSSSVDTVQQPVRQQRRRVTLMWRYMRENQAELELALASGAGPAVDDLAKLYGIPEQEQRAFGRRLRAEREALLASLRAPTLAMSDAAQFLSVLDALTQGVEG